MTGGVASVRGVASVQGRGYSVRGVFLVYVQCVGGVGCTKRAWPEEVK